MPTLASSQIVTRSACCGFGSRKVIVSYNYAEGSVVYSVNKAQYHGVLESVYIKNVRLIQSKKTFGRIIALYVDKNNWLWNEDELCLEQAARDLALAYLENQQDLLQKALLNCEVVKKKI